MNSNNLCAFTDYRAFLNAYLAEKKIANPSFSLRAWCMKLGLRSPATLNMILRGKRHPGRDVTARLVRYFRFSANQRHFFESLIQLAKSGQNTQQATQAMETLRRLHPNHQFERIDFDLLEAISNWYFLALREMVNATNFREDSLWISKQLKGKVAPKKLEDAIWMWPTCLH